VISEEEEEEEEEEVRSPQRFGHADPQHEQTQLQRQLQSDHSPP